VGSHPFAPGDLVLLHDRVGRRYSVRLAAGGSSSLHTGVITHDHLIGRDEGVVVQTSRGTRLLALRPTFAERVVFSRRTSQPIYPKDLGAIVVMADVYPGARVLEAGTGTGALTTVLCRAVGPAGRVVSYEVRDEFHAKARETLADSLRDAPQLELRLGDVRDVEEESEFDRVCLDLPQPWDIADVVVRALRPGGIVFAHCPNLTQVQRFFDALRERRGFGLFETIELLQRGWAVRERSLRPMHRMVAHTGFLTFARRLAEPVNFEVESEGY
jgi:tRNA (adenine57-N1/adenine58-N1)-methyltransferase